MKMSLAGSALILLIGCSAFGQGKIAFKNDSLHLLYMSPNTIGYRAEDLPLAGKAVPVNGLLFSGATLHVTLYAGTSPDSLSVAYNGAFSDTEPGFVKSANITVSFAGSAAGSQNGYFNIKVDSDINYFGDGLYRGETGVFQCTASTVPIYYSLVQATTPASSTWAVGTYDLSYLGTGYKGAIEVYAMPEPGVMSLIGVAGGLILVQRRRKSRK